MIGGGYFGGSYGSGSSEGGAPINRVQNLQDNFNDNSLDTTVKWVNWGGLLVTESSQTLRIALGADAEYAGINAKIDSPPGYSLYDSYALIEVVDAGDVTLGSYEVYPVFLQVFGDEDNVVYWLITNGLKIAYKKVAGADIIVNSSAYNATTDKWFRIRESGGTVFWDTSPDGITWTNAGTSTEPFDLSSLEPNVFVGKWDAADTDSTLAIFDNFNIVSRSFTISGTFLLGGDVAAQSVHGSSISGTFKLGGSVEGFIQPILLSSGIKQFEYKIYDPATGDFLGRWDDVVSEFAYSQEINSAGSAIDIVLARNSDSLVRAFNPLATDSLDPIITDGSDEIAAEVTTANAIGPGTTVDLNLDVKVYVFPEGGEDIEGTLIFTGYISKYVTRYGREENTIVTLFSYGAELDNWVLEDTGDTRVPYLSQDPSVILKDALDKFNAAGGIPSYDQGATTVDTTGTTVSYTFNVNTMLEVIKKCLELAPTDWYWYYDMALNNVHFHEKSGTAHHTFVLGKHILELNLEKYIEDITNLVYFTGGDTGGGTNLFKKYTDATSISDFRRGLQRVNDNRVTLEASADIIVDSLIDRGKEPRYRSSIRIADKVYDIETIKLGQIVQFRNFGNYVDTVKMQIVRIDYHPDYVQLQLDTLLPSVPKRLEDVKRNLNLQETQSNPDAPLT
jgi:hypothetical protein